MGFYANFDYAIERKIQNIEQIILNMRDKDQRQPLINQLVTIYFEWDDKKDNFAALPPLIKDMVQGLTREQLNKLAGGAQYEVDNQGRANY